MNIWNWLIFYKKPPWLSGRVLLLKPRGHEFNPCNRQLFFFFTFSWGVCGFKPPLNLHDFFLRGIEFSLSFMTFRYHKWNKSDKGSSCQFSLIKSPCSPVCSCFYQFRSWWQICSQNRCTAVKWIEPFLRPY